MKRDAFALSEPMVYVTSCTAKACREGRAPCPCPDACWLAVPATGWKWGQWIGGTLFVVIVAALACGVFD